MQSPPSCIADAIHNAAGYGISGVNERGEVCWDHISNVRIWKIETATSFKSFIDNWNIQTALWLKSVCYDRAPYYRMPLTFVLSAIWHGVYPGYYFTFITAIPITLAARSVRVSLSLSLTHTHTHANKFSSNDTASYLHYCYVIQI
ncbi:Lysophospholipid acyltransferase 1 [Labeo rohita]|uniref:Lysophospholipid acyltransferase 1 n=1 Tax=Labeo rohita TaxID=84645 RepID=A0ABQ8LZ12_LABRO|nr:Lysophospholipid acyltransferase 1 [Labeo rohita]